MKKCFNNVQMFKSSENCDKYSKSVSYETLVGGTATTGTGYKQIRRLFNDSTDKPLTAVGTLTSLLCNSAKWKEKLLRHVITRRTLVRRGYLIEQSTHANKKSLFASVTWLMRLPRRIQRMLLVMTIPASCREAHKRRFLFNLIRRSLEKFFKKNFRDDSYCFGFAKVLALALVFTIATISESRAGCSRPDSKTGKCKTLEESGTCGKGCSYTYDSITQTVNITATGEDAKIESGAFHGSFYENNTMPAQTFVINGAIAIGGNAFNVSKEIISGTDGVLTLTGIGHHALGTTTFSGAIIIPEGAKFGSLAFSGFTLADNAKIYCGVENCAQKMIDSCEYGEPNTTWCLQKVNKILSDHKLLAYPENCLKMGATGCVKCKSDSFRLNDGYCDRVRYTPAEAAEVLHDDNTNEVTITFKK